MGVSPYLRIVLLHLYIWITKAVHIKQIIEQKDTLVEVSIIYL